MSKKLLTILLAGIVTISYACVGKAATVTFTKPTIKVETKQEESELSKKINKTKSDIEKAKSDAKAQQEANKKAAEERKKEAEARQKQRQDAINSFKDSFKTK